jgi:hypothetical protein
MPQRTSHTLCSLCAALYYTSNSGSFLPFPVPAAELQSDEFKPAASTALDNVSTSSHSFPSSSGTATLSGLVVSAVLAGTKPVILVVDDDATTKKLVARWLRDHATVLLASRGEEVIEPLFPNAHHVLCMPGLTNAG